MATIGRLACRPWWPAFSRLIRFGAVGLSCCGVQIATLVLLVQLGLSHAVANAIALVGVTQLNFLLSAAVIWPDRPLPGWPLRPRRWGPALLRRLLGFNLSTGLTLLLNEGVFILTLHVAPYVIAALCGIAVAAPLNFVIEHYLIFRHHEHAHERARLAEPEGTIAHEAPDLRLGRLPGL